MSERRDQLLAINARLSVPLATRLLTDQNPPDNRGVGAAPPPPFAGESANGQISQRPADTLTTTSQSTEGVSPAVKVEEDVKPPIIDASYVGGQISNRSAVSTATSSVTVSLPFFRMPNVAPPSSGTVAPSAVPFVLPSTAATSSCTSAKFINDGFQHETILASSSGLFPSSVSVASEGYSGNGAMPPPPPPTRGRRTKSRGAKK